MCLIFSYSRACGQHLPPSIANRAPRTATECNVIRQGAGDGAAVAACSVERCMSQFPPCARRSCKISSPALGKGRLGACLSQAPTYAALPNFESASGDIERR